MSIKLTFKYVMKKITKINKNILEDDEIKQKLNKSSSVYSDYMKNNGHSGYLHSHTLQQAIIHAVPRLQNIYNIR